MSRARMRLLLILTALAAISVGPAKAKACAVTVTCADVLGCVDAGCPTQQPGCALMACNAWGDCNLVCQYICDGGTWCEWSECSNPQWSC